MVTIKQVFVQADYRYILKNINLSISQGELIGIMGPNGAGKTTLLKVIMGLVKPSEGKIEWQWSSGKEPGILSRHIGAVLDESFLYNDLTVLENLDFYADLYQITNKVQRVNKLLYQFQMTHRKHDRVSSLSKGLKKRVALMRGMLHQPVLWLLDEPFDGLDQLSVRLLAKHMRDHIYSGGTVIFISHIMSYVSDLATRVLLLENGELKADCAIPAEWERFTALYGKVNGEPGTMRRGISACHTSK
ncbi:heme exporter protein CcmA [Caldalkalibacillus thermarum TA2.A1]|uniref:Heme exporter protein CcmA n=1 Tax=Caldalkalibacillus thermarum (strain TA2.A1) TaxID=986075 RepID=F5L3F2_CALTT|nr:heme ABC exporter ATP-binding protein CcmA [Caldalkalibacillus thermarum]EGL84131.1 heme exporter protein CcmA [Caldalkalibacillus thermarum TA2.A1]